MTKREAKRFFMAGEYDRIIHKYGRHDKPAMREAWVNYIDSLHREGHISDKQAQTWDQPF